MFLFPPSMMKGGIFYEHGHRLFASLVGFLTIGNCLFLWLMEKRNWLRWTGTFALGLVIAQGVLGGLTVRSNCPCRFRPPMPARRSCSSESRCSWLSPAPAPGSTPFPAASAWDFGNRPCPWLSASPSSCKSWSAPSCATAMRAFPFRPFPWPTGAGFRRSGNSASPYTSCIPASARPVIVILGAALIVSIFASKRLPGKVKGLAGFLALALFVQCLLGMMTIWSGKAPVPTTFHLSVGALVFATGLLLFLAIYRLQIPVSDRTEVKGNAVNPHPDSIRQDGMALT